MYILIILPYVLLTVPKSVIKSVVRRCSKHKETFRGSRLPSSAISTQRSGEVQAGVHHRVLPTPVAELSCLYCAGSKRSTLSHVNWMSRERCWSQMLLPWPQSVGALWMPAGFIATAGLCNKMTLWEKTFTRSVALRAGIFRFRLQHDRDQILFLYKKYKMKSVK